MIATAVQHVSQIAEIQGAPVSSTTSVPSGAPNSGEEFRAAFAASVGGNTVDGKGKTAALPDAEKSAWTSSSKEVALARTGAGVRDKGSLVKTRLNALNVSSETSSASNAVAAAKTNTISAAETDDISAVARVEQHFASADAAPGFASPQASVDLAANVPATGANPSAQSNRSAIVGDHGFAGLTAASAHAISTPQAKEPAQTVESAGSRNRKSDTAASSKDEVAREARQTSTVVEGLGALVLPIVPQPVAAPAIEVSLLATGQVKSATIAEGLGKLGVESNGNAARITSSALAVASPESTSSVAEPKDGGPDKRNALSAISSAIAGQPGANQVQAAHLVDAPHTNQSRPAIPEVATARASGDDAALNPSASVSEMPPASSVVTGAASSVELDKSPRQQGTVGSKNISTGPGDTTTTAQYEKTSKSSQSVEGGVTEAGAALKPHSGRSDISPDAGVTGEGNLAVASLPDTKNTTALSPSAGVGEPPVQAGTVPPAPIAGQVPQPATLPSVAIAAPQSVAAGSKDRAPKRTVGDGGSADATPQDLSAKGNATSVPNADSAATRDGASNLASVASSSIAVPVGHTPTGTATGPVHAGISAVPTGLTQASTRTAGGLNGGLNAEPSAVSQSSELHRTLLATPTALEVGVQSGTQGWLKIRAEVGGQGEVKASLDAVTASGRDLLHSQLPALNAFLHNEQMSVTASVAERSLAPQSSIGGTAMNSGGFGGANSSDISSGSSAQSGGNPRDAEQHATTGATGMVRSYDAEGGVSDSATVPSGLQVGTSAESGRWLNIRV